MSGKTDVEAPAFFKNLLNFVRDHQDVQAITAHLAALATAANRAEISYFGPETRSAGHRAYDGIIADIFTSVISATSREELLRQTVESLSRPELASSALCHFVLETQRGRTADGHNHLRLLTHTRLNEHLWRNFEAAMRTRLNNSAFLQGLLLKGTSVDLWLSNYLSNYAGEFDVLAYADRKLKRIDSYWISAISLKGEDADRPNRALIALYENRGGELKPTYMSGAAQEWRVFHFLGIAYKVLNHQLQNVAQEVHQQRQKLLSFLAPGIMHHEIGAQIGNIKQLLPVVGLISERLSETYQNKDTERLVTCLELLNGSVDRLELIASSFNNMEVRKARETINLEDILEEVYTLLYHRLGKVGADFVTVSSEDLAETNIESDPALLMHLFLNIIINATNAFEERKDSTAAPSPQIAAVLARSDKGSAEGTSVRLNLFNNGPAIPEDILERIFEKGFTTRALGHGHGLYICRLIAGALGGKVRALHPTEIPSEWSVGFQIDLPLAAGRDFDLMGEGAAGRK